jgi:outer membrane murein-binding lipoprotein Lpp
MRTQNSEFRIQNFIVPLCLCGILFFAGCEEKKKINTSAEKPKVLSQKETQKSQKAAPASQKETKDANSTRKLTAEVEQLKKQLEGLMGINKQARIEAISTITSIDVTSRSNLYDKNNDKKKEMLVVYLRPIDDMGDCIKAAGAAEVQLWNLSAESNDALLKSWKIEPKELRGKWSGSLLTSYYKLQFDVSDIPGGKEKDLTLKVQFTDYLTGKVLKAQRVINSR